MALPGLCCRLPKWRNPFAEFEVNYMTLEFENSQSEKAFATELSRRLAKHVRLIGLILFFFEAAWLATQDFDVQSPQYDGDVTMFHITMVARAGDAFMGLTALLVAIAGVVQLRWSKLSPRQFEIMIVTCLVLELVASAMTDLHFVIAFAWPDSGVSYERCTRIALMIDCIVTVANFMPLRWSSVIALDFLAMVWYPVLHLSLLGSPPWAELLVLLCLILYSALGKRELEMQERRLFRTVLSERTLRASSEFRLCQDLPPGKRGATESNAPSVETGDLFDVKGAAASDLTTSAVLHRIKLFANEQWLIPSTEISVQTSNVIGSGGFGAVVEGSLSGLPVAVKLALEPIRNEVAKGLASLVSELRILRKVRHPNIVLFLGAVIDPELCEVAVVLELVVGPNLAAFIAACEVHVRPLPDPCLYGLSCDVARALRYLHAHSPPIVHGDLKPGNLLVDYARSSMPRAKLVDFGLSRILSGKVGPLGGSRLWIAPEVHDGDRRPTTSVDIYGAGRIMSYMITGMLPMRGLSAGEVRTRVMSGYIDELILPNGASALAGELHSIVEECTALDPVARPCAAQVCQRFQELGGHADFRDCLGDIACERWGLNTTSGIAGPSGDPKELPVPWELAIPKLRSAIPCKRDVGQGPGSAPASQAKSSGRPPAIRELAHL